MDVLTHYLDQGMLDFLTSLFVLITAGVLLAVLAWMVSIIVHAAFRWIRG